MGSWGPTQRNQTRREFLAAATIGGIYPFVHPLFERTDTSAVDAWVSHGATSSQTNANPTSPPISESPTTKWTYTATRSVSAPIVANATVYFTAEDNHLYAVDAETGREQWNSHFEAGIGGVPAYDDGGLFVCGYNDAVYRIAPDTGAVIWKSPLDSPATVYGAGYSPPSPVVTSGLVFVPTETELYALEADSGDRQWTRQLSSREKGVLTYPAVANGRVLIGEWTGAISIEAENRGVHAYDAATGEHLWSNNPETRADGIARLQDTPAATADAVYVTSEAGDVHRLDATTGEFVWTHSLDTDWLPSGLTVTDSVGCLHTDRSILALSLETGDVAWRRSIDQPMSSLRPAADGGQIYTTVGESIRALDLASGDQQWSHPVSFGPYTAVAGGTAYVAGNNSITAIEAKDKNGIQGRQTGTRAHESLVSIGAGLSIVLSNLYAIWRYRRSPEN